MPGDRDENVPAATRGSAVKMRRVTAPDNPNSETEADFDAFWRHRRRSLETWYVKRWGLGPQDAENVAQEAFAGLAQQWSGLRTDEHRRRMYSRITRHKVIDYLRAQQRRALVQPEVYLDEDGIDVVADEATTNPAAIFGGRDISTPLWAAVERLPEVGRRAIVGRYVAQLSYDELAELTGRSPSALRQDVKRSLAGLRRVLKAPALVMLGLCDKARRAAQASIRLAVVASEATVLGLVFTAPLPVLERDGHRLADALRPPPLTAVLALPAPIVATLAAVQVTAMHHEDADVKGVEELEPEAVHRRKGPATTAAAPQLCVKSDECSGERITVHVLGKEPSASQSYVKVCWAFPKAAEPYVTCRPDDKPA